MYEELDEQMEEEYEYFDDYGYTLDIDYTTQE